MADSITWDIQATLVQFVMKARTLRDLGLIPFRTWALTGACARHGRLPATEITIPETEQPPTTVRCELCVIARDKYISPLKHATAVVIRG